MSEWMDLGMRIWSVGCLGVAAVAVAGWLRVRRAAAAAHSKAERDLAKKTEWAAELRQKLENRDRDLAQAERTLRGAEALAQQRAKSDFRFVFKREKGRARCWRILIWSDIDPGGGGRGLQILPGGAVAVVPYRFRTTAEAEKWAEKWAGRIGYSYEEAQFLSGPVQINSARARATDPEPE